VDPRGLWGGAVLFFVLSIPILGILACWFLQS
jgi:hypothetical protein